MGVVDADLTVDMSKGLRQILTNPRGEVHTKVAKHWLESARINELRLLPGLIFEGKWKNDSVLPRKRLLQLLEALEDRQWVSLKEFVEWGHYREPDILRSGGEYDSWFIRSAADETFLKGFKHWHEIEGEWLRFMIGNVMHPMGYVDLMFDKKSDAVNAFRKSESFEKLIRGESLQERRTDVDCFTVQKNGNVLVRPDCTREALYHIARICQWETRRGGKIHLTLNHKSLMRAKIQGLTSANIIALIKKYGRGPLPENIIKGIAGWEKPTNSAALEPHTLIRTDEKSTLERILKGPAKDMITEHLNDRIALIRKKDAGRLAEKLAEMGIFIEIKPDI